MWRWLLVLAACHRESPPRTDVPILFERPGVSATQLEREVAIPLEQEVAAVKGVAHVASRSETGRVVLTVGLAPDADLFAVRSELAHRLPMLPMFGPTIRGHQTIRYAVPPEASDPLRIQLMQVPGVAGVITCGGQPPARVVELDAARLRAFGLLATAVSIDVETPDLEKVLDTRNGAPVRLGDVAQIRLEPHPDCLAFDAHGAMTTTGTVIARLGEDADALQGRIAKLVAIAKGRMLPAGDVVFTDATDTQALSQLTSSVVETGEGEPWEPANGSRIYTDKPYGVIAALAAHQIEAYTTDSASPLCGPRDKLDAAQLDTNAHVIGGERGRTIEIGDARPAGVMLEMIEQTLALVGPGVDVGHWPQRVIVHVTGDPDVAPGVPLSTITHPVDHAPLVRLREDGESCIRFGPRQHETNIVLRKGDGLHQR